MTPNLKVDTTQSDIRRLFSYLGLRRRVQFAGLLVAMLSSGAFEFLSVGAVFPFIAALASPEEAAELPVVRDAVRIFEVETPNELVIILAVGFAVSVVIAGFLKLAVLWGTIRFSVVSGAALAKSLYLGSLQQPYRVHISRNSAEIISASIKKVDAVANGTISNLQNLVYSTLMIVFISTSVFLIDYTVAILCVVLFGGLYLLIGLATQSVLRRNSRIVAELETETVKSVQEGLGGIRDILMAGTQDFFVRAYERVDRPLRTTKGTNLFLSSSPRTIMEMIALALVALLAYNFSSKQGGIAAGLPLLGTLALGGFRLLPALQMSYSSWSNLQINRVMLGEVIDLLEKPEQVHNYDIGREVKFSESIVLEDVGFCYEESGPHVLNNVNISIKKGSTIGFKGETGSGKSTLLDIIMGLLDPTSGRLLIDGRGMEPDSVRLWSRRIAHVPQEVFLSDNSFAENIAFGVPEDSIDLGRLREVAETACILEFIENHRAGFGAKLGERGVRLSGGQRQRIGIARALYHKPDVLILDEATNALDSSTEMRVMEGVTSLDSGITLVVVSHRRSTLDYCDEVFRVANGTLAPLM